MKRFMLPALALEGLFFVALFSDCGKDASQPPDASAPTDSAAPIDSADATSEDTSDVILFCPDGGGCPDLQACAYPVGGGCGAERQCFRLCNDIPPKMMCGCDGTQVPVAQGCPYASQPLTGDACP